jgi:branched-chain amino acid transport system ATP-binding protein
MPEIALEVRNIIAGYVPDLPILRGVSIKVKSGSLNVVIGPNGAGKSTLIKAIVGLVSISEGHVLLRGKEMYGIKPHLIASYGISYVPQIDNIFRTLTVRQNLELALRSSGKNANKRLTELLEQFPILSGKLKEKAGALSGGQRQFLAVAMALSTYPDIILMDEPSAGLAPKAAQEILEMLRDLTNSGVSILLIEQNVNQALRLADYCYILAEGRNQVDGKASELLNNSIVGEIYLGGKRLRAGA